MTLRTHCVEWACVSSFSVAAIKCHKQGDFQKEEFVWAYGFRKTRIHQVKTHAKWQALWQGQEAGTSVVNLRHKTEDLEVGRLCTLKAHSQCGALSSTTTHPNTTNKCFNTRSTGDISHSEDHRDKHFVLDSPYPCLSVLWSPSWQSLQGTLSLPTRNGK